MSAATDRLANALSDRYHIVRELGAGGMATVYLAADLKHERSVAIKVLKPELAAVLGAERFVQEIKTTAALSHPHILPLFDSGEADGFLYYVMPYIQGETIREMLNRETQLGIAVAVKIATEVADALDYAHRHGVIHRDIKPENVLLHDGRPMVMDFGIALAVSAAAGGRMTETGLSLGTPHYMSPEQATADKQITNRSDIYSLASVLYEMLAGEPPHMGNSAQQIIMKIIAEPVAAVTTLRKSVPPNVAAALAKALEKLPADRFSSAREFADALLNPSFSAGTVHAMGASTDMVKVIGRTVSWRSVAAILAAACVGLLAMTFVREPATAKNLSVVRAELEILTRSDSGVVVSGLDISPDGSLLVYSARSMDERNQLYLRRLEERTARAIPGTEGAEWPTFSPDGGAIAFVHDRSAIRRIPVGGAVSEYVLPRGERSDFRGLRWGADGFLYYRNAIGDDLMRVPALGGTPKVLTGVGAPQEPEPLPGGKHVLFTECCTVDSDVSALNVETGETKTLGVKARFVRYLATGHLLLISGDALRAVPFDAGSLTVRGEPRILLDSVAANGTLYNFAISRNGIASYFVRPLIGDWSGQRPTLVDLAGNDQRIALPDANYREFRFSPDGRSIAYSSTPFESMSKWDVFVHDLVVGTTIKLTGSPSAYTGGLLWVAGGRDLLYTADNARDSITFIGSARADGSGTTDTIWRTRLRAGGSETRNPLSLTSDGKRVLLERDVNRNTDIVIAPLDSALGAPTDYLVASWRERTGVLSPDNRWVAYASNEEAPATQQGQTRIYVRAFPEPGVRYAVSDSIGSDPRWAPDGKTIYYRRGQTMVAASVTTTPTFRVTGRRDLVTRPGGFAWYDISPDGKQFVMRAPPRSAAARIEAGVIEPVRLVVVANWMEEFRRKVR